MPRPAASIIREALRTSKTGQLLAGQSTMSGYTQDALDALNSVLDHLSETIDFAKATRQFFFTFAPNLVTQAAGNVVTAAANPLPIGYQRVQTSGGSTGAQRTTKWYLSGVPYDMVEIDLTEWDDQVQQAGIQSYPYFCAKDMSGGSVLVNFQGDLDSTTNVVSNLSSCNPVTGAVVAATPAALAAGMTLDGGIGPLTPIVPGTRIVSVNAVARTMVLSAPPTYLTASPGTSWSGTLSQASLMAGWPANLLIYPPPSGAFNAMIRYQTYMPPLTQAQVNAGAFCWYEDDNSLIDLLSRRLMGIADDTRLAEYEQLTERLVGKYSKLADDRANRAQTVQMDRRSFGHDFSRLKNTKTVGW
jgi:hypothetical protein